MDMKGRGRGFSTTLEGKTQPRKSHTGAQCNRHDKVALGKGVNKRKIKK